MAGQPGGPATAQPGSVTLDAELLTAQVAIQDLIVKIELHDLFNVWVGKMVLPLDRANLSGPWFINYWMLRGSFPRSGVMVPPPYGIKSGPFGRDQGITVWGQVLGGRFKYYLGSYSLDNQSTDAHPMFAGRLCLNVLDPEPGYYNQSAYHGEKDILAIGVGGQIQKLGSVLVIPANPETEQGDLKVVEVDALLDKKLGSHVVTAEASYYHTDKWQPVNRLYVFGLGYVSPPVGVGRLAPAVRFQIGTVPDVFDPVTNDRIARSGWIGNSSSSTATSRTSSSRTSPRSWREVSGPRPGSSRMGRPVERQGHPARRASDRAVTDACR